MPAYPFSAIVGQDLLKRALLLGVIQPHLGGVLVRGARGVAKSTAVRGLAAVLPPLETVVGCPFQRLPGEIIADWPLPENAAVIRRPVPLVELPLGATEDRVLGTLHLEKALCGERVFEPGLLAAANRGLLYIDEVNLLPDHLVDVLLDAAADGVHRVEREGLSLSHPSRFLLVGTMNPEEGDLRPQLLDRFGLAVDVTDLTELKDRSEAVRRRLNFEADALAFAATWNGAETALAERIKQARHLLPEVRIGDDLLRSISERCQAANVEGLRADLTMCRAACAWAAYQGRRDVEAIDVDAVAELALAHRRRTPPEPPPSSEGRKQKAEGRRQEPGDSGTTRSGDASPVMHFDSAGDFASRVGPAPAPAEDIGRRRGRSAERRSGGGPPRVRFDAGAALAWAATVRTASLHQQERGRSDGVIVLRRDDLRFRPPRGPAGGLLLFVVDASGSMAAWRRMRQTKAALLALLRQGYRQRDRVALLAFRGQTTDLVLPPTRCLATARRAIEALPVGGPTPLAQALGATERFIRQQRRRQASLPIWTVLLTDGRANIGFGGDPWRDALGQARHLAACDTEILVVDTESGWPRFGRAAELAHALGADCLPLEDVIGTPLLPRRVV